MINAEVISLLKQVLAQIEWGYPMEYAAAIDKAIEALEGKDKDVPTKWIRCKDRPPEVGQNVLILSRYGHVSDAVLNYGSDGYYFDPFGYELHDGYATHWMPRPEEPGEGTKSCG